MSCVNDPVDTVMGMPITIEDKAQNEMALMRE